MANHFFIVGAQRAGTTYLYVLLDEHPEIEMARPLKPEPKFFLNDSLFAKGLDYYEEHFFGSKPAGWLRGEKSTTYIESKIAAKRIADAFPDANIVIVLRNPVERAISNYWFSVNNGIENASMEDAFINEGKRWLNYDRSKFSTSPFAYLQRGRYAEYISLYEKHFPQDNIKLILFEELITEPGVLRDLFGTLGVHRDFVPNVFGQVVNASQKAAGEMTPALRDYLREYFSDANSELAERFKLNLQLWQ